MKIYNRTETIVLPKLRRKIVTCIFLTRKKKNNNYKKYEFGKFESWFV